MPNCWIARRRLLRFKPSPTIKVRIDVKPDVLHLAIDDPLLEECHERGAGIYITVNTTDFKGRRKENIVRVRAIWRENDGDARPLPAEPSLIVETSVGHFHEYFLISGNWPADGQGRADFDGVMERMVCDYGSDKHAKDINRVLRVPGFTNRKYGEPFQIRIKSVSGWRYSRPEILRLFPPVPKQPPAATVSIPANSNPSVRLRAILEIVAHAKQGDRNSITFWCANRIREMAAEGALTKAEFAQACGNLIRAATGTGLSAQEAQRTIASAMRQD